MNMQELKELIYQGEKVDIECKKAEKNVPKSILDIKKKYGKNAVLRGLSYEEGATTRTRNGQIGGHKA